MKSVLLSIHCITYNQASYIRGCLEGFVMQKTNFAFEAIVHDDCSTDGTTDIIREYAEKYPDIIKPIFEKENLYSKKDGSLTRLMNDRMRGKYIAYCEGDDYWVDPYKLQKQVDYLEEHPECGLVYGKARALKDHLLDYSYGAKTSFEELLMCNTIPTLTVVVRTEIYNKYFDSEYYDARMNLRWMMGDYPLWLYVASCSQVHFMNEDFSVYRITENSASRPQNIKKRFDFIVSAFDIAMYYAERNKLVSISDLDIKRRWASELLYISQINQTPIPYTFQFMYHKYGIRGIKVLLKNKMEYNILGNLFLSFYSRLVSIFA